MRRIPWRAVPVALLVILVVQIGSCRVYDALVRPTAASGLVRDAERAPSGWTVSYIRAPGGPAARPRLVYVHGTPGDATAFEDYLLAPVPGFDAVSVDRPGFGHTLPREPALTLRAQAQSLEPFLQPVHGRKPLLVGHSLGAPIVLRAALDYPERVGGLVLISASVDPDLEKVAWYQHLASYAPIAWMIPRFLRNANRELFPFKRELEKLAAGLDRLQCPVVIIHAPNDSLVPIENVDYLKQQLPEGTIIDTVILDGKNHFVPWNAEDSVKRAIETVVQAARNAESGSERLAHTKTRGEQAR